MRETNIKLLPVHKLISAAVFLCLVSQNSTICFLPCHLLTHQVENTQWIGCYKFWFYSFGVFFVFFSWLLEIVADALNPNSLCYCAHYVVPVFFLSVSIRKHKPLPSSTGVSFKSNRSMIQPIIFKDEDKHAHSSLTKF